MTDPGVDNYGKDYGDTSSGLIQRAKGLDQAAWNRMLTLYTPLVYRWCREFGLQPADAADVGQEVFRSVFRNLPCYHHNQQGDSFRGWLHTITRNKIRDLWRAKPRERTGRWLFSKASNSAYCRYDDDSSTAPLSEQALLCTRLVELVRACYGPKRWLAFWKVTVEERCPQDVAEELGLTVNAVYVAKSRVLRHFKHAWAELESLESG